MTSPIRETRQLVISHVVVTPKEIREITGILEEGAKKIRHDRSLHDISFKILAFDGSEYDSASTGIFEEGGLLDTKLIRRVEMNLLDYTSLAHKQTISIVIKHGGGSWERSQVTVSGMDSIWVNGLMRRFEETMGGWEAQPSWPHRFRYPMMVTFAFGIGRLYQLVLNMLLDYLIPPSPRPTWAEAFVATFQWLLPLLWWLQWIAALGVGIWPAMLLVGKIEALWPDVEIRTGPEYAQVERKRRHRLGLALSLGVLPILLSVLYDLVKWFWR